jgi:hypothetical protein
MKEIVLSTPHFLSDSLNPIGTTILKIDTLFESCLRRKSHRAVTNLNLRDSYLSKILFQTSSVNENCLEVKLQGKEAYFD